MTDKEHNTELEASAARRYRKAANDLDPGTRSALRRARAAALARAGRPRSRWLGAGAVAAGAGALIVAGVVWRGPDPVPVPPELAADDFEFLLDGEDLDLLAELDFYQWLEGQPDVG